MPATAIAHIFSDAEIEQLTGGYQIASKYVLTISEQDNQFFAQLTGQEAVPIFAKAKNQFFYRGVDAAMTFKFDEQGRVQSLIFHQGGNHPAKKIK